MSAITDPKHKISFPTTTGSQPVPLILIDVMRKCLQRDPKARPTVAELLEISYLQSSPPAPVPNIRPEILRKIKRALTDEEWKELTDVSILSFHQREENYFYSKMVIFSVADTG